MKAGDFSTVIADAVAQVEAGAQMLDVNAGIPLADEPAILAETMQLVQSLTDVPLSIDSSIVAALEAGLARYEGKPLVNSVTGEDERLESVLPLVAKLRRRGRRDHERRDRHLRGPRRAVRDRQADRRPRGRPRHRDGGHRRRPARDADRRDGHGAGGRSSRWCGGSHDELGVNTTCGASNVSFGLPEPRTRSTRAFLSMAIASGLTSAITSPLHARDPRRP